jgi:hypothetical protein
MNRPTTLILVAIAALVPATATAEPTRALAALAPLTPEGGPDAAAPKPFVEPESEKRGFVLDTSFGLLMPTGNYGGGVPMDFGPGQSFSLMLGGYFTKSFGLLAGGRISGDHRGSAGCSDGGSSSKCGGISYGFPVVARFSLDGRKAGPYVEAGVVALATYMAFAGDATLTARSPVDTRFGFGWLFDIGTIRGTSKPSPYSLDLRAGAEVGRFSEVSDGRTTATIQRQDTHVTYELSAGVRFTP